MKTPVTNTDDPAVERNISRSDMDIVIAVLDKIPELSEVPATLGAIQVLEASVVDKAGEVAANTLTVQSETATTVSNATSALASKNAAKLSEINTSNSANSVSIYKDNALASAVSANASAQSALDSKDSANLSAVSASTSESIATQKALEASVSASNALVSETNASNSANIATNASVVSSSSAQASADSAVLANQSAGSASISATTATTKASEASVSASEALSYKDIAVSAANSITNMQVATGLPNSAVTWDGTTLTIPKSINGIDGIDGTSIVSVIRTSGTGTAGTTDTYTITYTDNSTSTFTVYNGADGTGSGDMNKSIYDINNSGVVDNAEKVNGLTVQTAVPTGAVFTDTVYDDTGVLKDTDIDISIQRYDVNTVIDSMYVHTDNNFTNTLKSKLDSLSNYTKPTSEPISYISGLDSALNSKVDKIAGKGLSTEDYTTIEKTKLSGIASGAQVNVPTDLSLGTVTATVISLNSSTGTDVNLPLATTSTAGLLSATDKNKLDGVATNANNYTLPTATSAVKGGIEIYSDTVQSVASNAVTTTASRTYGVQLNSAGQAVVNIPWIDTDTVYTHPTTDGSLHVPATSTDNNGKVLMAGATAGSVSWQTIPSGVTDHTLLTNIGTNTHAQIDTALTRLVNTSGTNTGDQTITLTGDVTGSGTGNITTSLSTIDGVSGTYGSSVLVPSITVDSKGRIISVTENAVSGGGVDVGTIVVTGGDFTMSGTTGTNITNATLANSGVTAGEYTKVAVNSKGIVTSGTNPTTIAGFGITDVYTKTEVDIMYGDIASALDTINGEVV